MGSHIDCYFPHNVARTSAAVHARLEAALGELGDDLALIQRLGRFSSDGGDWSLWEDERGICGEGPGGLSISVWAAVVNVTSVERFGAVARPDQGIDAVLHRVFEALAAEFGADGRLAVAAGGLGDTDRANDLALAGASFSEVCDCLTAEIGMPARNWESLRVGAATWYLSESIAGPGRPS